MVGIGAIALPFKNLDRLGMLAAKFAARLADWLAPDKMVRAH